MGIFLFRRMESNFSSTSGVESSHIGIGKNSLFSSCASESIDGICPEVETGGVDDVNRLLLISF